MYVKLALALTVFCVVILRATSEKTYDGRPYTLQKYKRMKPAKYYSSPPQRHYSKPVSYSPPPSYAVDKPQYSAPQHRHPKVSKRPTNDGLGDDDINNFIKNFSKQDLQKLLDLAGEKDKYSETNSEDPFEEHIEYIEPPKDDLKSTYSGLNYLDSDNYSVKPLSNEDSQMFKAFVQEIDTDSQYSLTYQEPKPFSVEYSKPSETSANFVTSPTPPQTYFADFQNNNLYHTAALKSEEVMLPSANFVASPTPPQTYFAGSQNNNLYNSAALKAEEMMLKNQIAYLKSQINDGVVYTDSKIMPEEELPKPMNLREEQDYDVSQTKYAPTVVKADQSSSYKLENFGDLPLMNYNSKLDTLSSFHVPLYTVTSYSAPSTSYSAPTSSYSAPSSSYSAPSPYGPKEPPVEPAPPPSAAKYQSDAHLKAIKIWSHKSKGAAYTLHDDGSLSPEKHYGYGH